MKYFTLLILLCCTKNSYTKKEIWEMAKEEDPKLQLILPSDQFPAVNCIDYKFDCMYGMRVIVLGIHMIVVRFETEKGARDASLRLDAYYKYNWLFDEVTGEPVLEDFVKKVFDAKRPRLDYKIPKGIDKKEIGSKIIYPSTPLEVKKNFLGK